MIRSGIVPSPHIAEAVPIGASRPRYAARSAFTPYASGQSYPADDPGERGVRVRQPKRSRRVPPLPAADRSHGPQPSRRRRAVTAAAAIFERFTNGAKDVLLLAQQEAQRFNHNYIGTEHLLLGLVRQEEGAGRGVLGTLGVELDRVRHAVEFIIGRGDRTVTGPISLTPRSKKVVQLAIDEAAQLGHTQITEQHLLLGLAREGQGIAAGVLNSLGVGMDVLTERLLGAAPDVPPRAKDEGLPR